MKNRRDVRRCVFFLERAEVIHYLPQRLTRAHWAQQSPCIVAADWAAPAFDSRRRQVPPTLLFWRHAAAPKKNFFPKISSRRALPWVFRKSTRWFKNTTLATITRSSGFYSFTHSGYVCWCFIKKNSFFVIRHLRIECQYNWNRMNLITGRIKS